MKTVAARILLVLLAGAVFSCDESLPPRRSPADFLRWNLSIVGAGQPLVIRNWEPVNIQGAIRVRVTNVYDEVLQDSAVLAGRVQVWVKGRPQIRGEFPLTISDLMTRKMMTGKILTIGVDSTLEMVHEWDYFDDRGDIPLWQYFTLYPDKTEGGTPFCRSDAITLVYRCSLRIFKRFGQVQFPDLEVPTTFHVFGYPCSPPL